VRKADDSTTFIVPKAMKIRSLNLPDPPRACSGLSRDSFIFTPRGPTFKVEILKSYNIGQSAGSGGMENLLFHMLQHIPLLSDNTIIDGQFQKEAKTLNSVVF
jgi:hypothetical protein